MGWVGGGGHETLTQHKHRDAQCAPHLFVLCFSHSRIGPCLLAICHPLLSPSTLPNLSHRAALPSRGRLGCLGIRI